MDKSAGARAWVHRVRILALGTSALLLAGCVTGYSFVQPEGVYAGSYYTSDGPAPGYYYAPSAYGYYGGYGYGPSVNLMLNYGYAMPGYYGGYGYGHGYGYRHARGASQHRGGWNHPGEGRHAPGASSGSRWSPPAPVATPRAPAPGAHRPAPRPGTPSIKRR